jgi:hypothetical protein
MTSFIVRNGKSPWNNTIAQRKMESSSSV